MKNAQKIIIGIIIIVVIAMIGVWGFNQGKMANNNANIANINLNTNQAADIKTSLQIDKQDGSTVSVFSVNMKKDQTALEQLQKIADENKVIIEVKTESFGSYINAIDGLVGGTDGKYWMLSVNGKLSDIGADQYKLAEGDVVEWKFTK